MFAALVLPDFALQVALTQRPDLRQRAVALLDESFGSPSELHRGSRGKAPVFQATPTARQAGVNNGMTASQAQARCPGIHLLYRDDSLERAAQTRLLDLAASCTADYENTAPGIVCMDWGCVPNLRQRAQSLAQGLLDQLDQRELQGRFALAPNPDLAVLSAHLANPIRLLSLQPDNVRADLSPLPIEVLLPEQEPLQTLRLWGIHTLGQLTALPRSDIARRLGTEGAELWDHAAGKRHRLLQLSRSPEMFQQRLDLDHPLHQTEPLLFLMQRFLETLCARLEATWRVARELVLRLEFESGHDHPTDAEPCSHHERHLRIAEPSRDPLKLFRLLSVHLENFAAPAPIVTVEIELIPGPPRPQQTRLFEGHLRDAHRFAETLSQIEANLGSERVGTPVPSASHRVDHFGQQPFHEATQPATTPRPFHIGLPCRQLRPHQHAKVKLDHGRPAEIESGDLRGRVLDAEGPWLLSGHWWDQQAWDRREWDVELETGTLCRLVFEQGDWFLEGYWG